MRECGANYRLTLIAKEPAMVFEDSPAQTANLATGPPPVLGVEDRHNPVEVALEREDVLILEQDLRIAERCDDAD